MSVYKRTGAQTYSYDFRYRNHRYSGCTGETVKAKAVAWEKAEKERIKSLAIDTGRPLTVQAAFNLYWHEQGQFHGNNIDTLRNINWLRDELGCKRLIASITDADVARLIAKRRAEGLANKTVNMYVIEPLREMLNRAATMWGQPLPRCPAWKNHKLRVAQERIRELTEDEERRYLAACREDYHPLIRFALLSGCRRQECLDLEWRDIDWRGGYLTVTGKGDEAGAKLRRIPLSAAILDVLRPLPRAHAKVFTAICRRADASAEAGVRRGDRIPITAEAWKSTHRRVCARAGITDFRIHDFRHTAASRLMRNCGNIKLVRDLLGHADIATTSRYAHVGENDLLNAMNAKSPTQIITRDTSKSSN